MIDRHQEADILRSLAEAYQEIVEMARRNAGTGGGGKKARYVQNAANTPVGYIQDNSDKKIHVGMDKLKADAAKERKQIEKNRAKEQEARKARARANKEKRIKREGEAFLDQIRGKK